MLGLLVLESWGSCRTQKAGKLWGGGDFRSYSTIRQALLMVYTDPFTTHFVCTEEIDGKLNHSQVLIYALLFPPGLHLYNCSALVVFFLNIRKRKKEITLHFFVHLLILPTMCFLFRCNWIKVKEEIPKLKSSTGLFNGFLDMSGMKYSLSIKCYDFPKQP